LRTLAGVMHAYPTQGEAIRQAAVAFSRTRPPLVIGWLQRKWMNRLGR
jgi:hypothetical protein